MTFRKLQIVEYAKLGFSRLFLFLKRIEWFLNLFSHFRKTLQVSKKFDTFTY
jgi:hypothetical protein